MNGDLNGKDKSSLDDSQDVGKEHFPTEEGGKAQSPEALYGGKEDGSGWGLIWRRR